MEVHMQHLVGNANKRGESAAGTVQATLQKGKERTKQRSGLHKFIYWDRDAQLEAFFAWLPKQLHDAPGIDWKNLPAEIMGYCVRTIGSSLDAPVLAMVAASIHGAISISSQRVLLKQVNNLLRSLRSTGNMHCLADLKEERTWYEWVERQEKSVGNLYFLRGYASVTKDHFPLYLLRLDEADRQRMQHYALPAFPPDIQKKYFPVKQLTASREAKRKAETDILVPLYPILRQLVHLRKQLAERIRLAIREARHKVEVGEAVLPYHFQHTDTLPDINRDARTIADVSLQGRQVTMNFILWDKRSWVTSHRDRYSVDSVTAALHGKGSYSQEHNCFFIQFNGPPSDLLWFGDLVKHRLFQRFDKNGLHQAGYQERWQHARQLGFTRGCVSGPSGLLDTGDTWFWEATERGEELIIEFESLYRGILYGAAMAMIALSNGSRTSELLQVSWNKERRVTRTEAVVILGKDGQPQTGEDGKPLMRQVKLHFQHLLPKGAKTEEERQLFPLSKEAMRLLGEIKTLLEETHGEVPIVAPAHTNAKYEHLKPERYLFQWDPSPDGKFGAIGVSEVAVLLRFMLHGLDLSTVQGKPIHVSVHVLRHVMATHARHCRNVPPEAIAYFFLHHRLKELTGLTPSLTDISEYYTLMTEEQRFAAIRADLDEQEELDYALLQAAPTLRDLEQMNEDLRAVFELWHALHPTALGNCGCPGLCPRGNDRALCLGCSYLVTDPERIGAALSWRGSYTKQAELLEAQGNFIDARQARIKVQQLDDVINVMRLQLQAEADGSYIPVHKVLPSPQRKREAHHAEES